MDVHHFTRLSAVIVSSAYRFCSSTKGTENVHLEAPGLSQARIALMLKLYGHHMGPHHNLELFSLATADRKVESSILSAPRTNTCINRMLHITRCL